MIPTIETPISPATRATALLTADAIPASSWSASARIVAVSGATVSDEADREDEQRRQHVGDVATFIPIRARRKMPTAAINGPAPMKRRGP